MNTKAARHPAMNDNFDVCGAAVRLGIPKSSRAERYGNMTINIVERGELVGLTEIDDSTAVFEGNTAWMTRLRFNELTNLLEPSQR